MKSDFIFHLSQEWVWLIKSLITGKFNLFTFTFIDFDIEVDKITGGIEINLGLLGFNLFILIPFKPMDKDLEDRINKLDEKTIRPTKER